MNYAAQEWVPFSCSSRSLARARPEAMVARDDEWLIRSGIRLIIAGDEDVTPLAEPGS